MKIDKTKVRQTLAAYPDMVRVSPRAGSAIPAACIESRPECPGDQILSDLDASRVGQTGRANLQDRGRGIKIGGGATAMDIALADEQHATHGSCPGMGRGDSSRRGPTRPVRWRIPRQPITPDGASHDIFAFGPVPCQWSSRPSSVLDRRFAPQLVPATPQLLPGMGPTCSRDRRATAVEAGGPLARAAPRCEDVAAAPRGTTDSVVSAVVPDGSASVHSIPAFRQALREPMIPGPPDDFPWPEPWRPLDESEASNEILAPQPFAEASKAFTFEAELQQEVCRGHPLYRIACRAVARNRDHHDEFLFVTARPDMPIARVHLTWAAESNPAFPYVEGYASWVAFRAAWAKPEA